MEPTPEQYEEIEKFADGNMTPEEEDAFLLEVSQSADLQDSLDLELALREDLGSLRQPESDVPVKEKNPYDDPDYIRSLIKTTGDDWPKKTVIQEKQGIHPDHQEHETRKVINLNLWLSIAVAAALIIAVCLIVWNFSQNSPQIAERKKDSVVHRKDSSILQRKDSVRPATRPEMQIDYARLYKTYYRKDNAPDEVPQLLADAFLDYEDGDYRKLERLDLYSLPNSRGRPTHDQNSPESVREMGHYYKAIAFIETNNEPKAVTNLNWVIDSAANMALRGKAQYYLALLHVKKGRKDDAIKLLDAVAANKGVKPYDSRARRLLQSLQP